MSRADLKTLEELKHKKTIAEKSLSKQAVVSVDILKWAIQQAGRVQELENERQTALEALHVVDEITEKMLLDYEHASAIGAYFIPSAEDLAADVGSIVLEALEQIGEDITEGQERVIVRKYSLMREALEFYASKSSGENGTYETVEGDRYPDAPPFILDGGDKARQALGVK